MIDKLYNWLDDRLELRPFVNEQLYHRVPRYVNPLDFLGLVSAFAFVNQFITGMLLAMWYQPGAVTAWKSVWNIMHTVPAGWIIRDLHYWGANLMVVVVFLHMLRVFYVGAYKKPRELTWIFGVVLFGITILFAFTGYLLPWDQQSYWASMVGTYMPYYAPIVGTWIVHLARGGAYLSSATLTRFYSIHMLLLPALFLVFFGGHFYSVLKKQMLMVEETDQSRDLPPEKLEKTATFFPNTVFQMTMLLVFVGAFLLLLALSFKAPLLAPADPLNKAHYSPVPIWFFYSIYQLLKLMPPWFDTLGIIGLPLIGGIVLVLIPWIDHKPSKLPKDRIPLLSVAGLVVAGVMVLTYWGSVAQGVALPSNSPSASSMLTANPSAKTVTVTVLEGQGGENGGLNFWGTSGGQATLTVPVGYTVKMTAKNVGNLPHSVVITNSASSFQPVFSGASTPHPVTGTQPGGTDKISFKVTKAGTYRLVCAVPGHEAAGMWTTFKVVSSGKATLSLGGSSSGNSSGSSASSGG